MALDERWQDLGIRILSALVLAPLGLVSIWLGGPVWAVSLAAIVTGLGLEWAGLCGVPALSWRGAVVPGSLLAAGLAAAIGDPAYGVGIWVAGGLLACAVRPALGAGIAYIGPAYLSLLELRAGPAGLRDVVFLALVVWTTDVGAYGIGRAVGGPRLAPRISPGKTWSGAVGGALCAMAAGAAMGAAHPWRAAFAALWLALVAQAGDLAESAIKRHFGAKDSGWIIPGHGGLLDRMDGVLAAAPAALLAAWWAGRGHVLWD